MVGRSMLGVCLGFAAVTYGLKVSRANFGNVPHIEDDGPDAITKHYRIAMGEADVDLTASCLDGLSSVSIDGHGTILDEKNQATLRSEWTSMLESLRGPAPDACNPAHIIADMIAFLAKAPRGSALKQMNVSHKVTGWENVSVCLSEGDTEHAYWDDVTGDNHAKEVVVGSSDGNFNHKGNCLDDNLHKTRYTQRCLNYDECCAESHGTIEHMVTNCANEYFEAVGDVVFGSACDVFPNTTSTTDAPSTTDSPR